MVGADGVKKPTSLVIATHHEMLTVVDFLSCRIVDEGVSASPQMLVPLDEVNRQSVRGHVDSGAQATEPATDNDHISAWSVHEISNCELSTANCMMARSKKKQWEAGVYQFEMANGSTTLTTCSIFALC